MIGDVIFLEICALTDVGKVRSNNQDFYETKIVSPDCAWAIVCDGMGGAAAGNIASKQAVQQIKSYLQDNFNDNLCEKDMKNFISDAVQQANSFIYSLAQTEPKFEGMGTTLVLILIKQNDIYIASAGDSRAYMINEQNIYQITKDHSIVQEMLDSGQINEEEAVNHPRKNIITRALGVSEKIEIDYYQLNLDTDFVLFMCTDGFSNYASKEKILEIINNHSFAQLGRKCIDFANEAGGQDNITIVAIRRNN